VFPHLMGPLLAHFSTSQTWATASLGVIHKARSFAAFGT
jgi:hypothetical protein